MSSMFHDLINNFKHMEQATEQSNITKQNQEVLVKYCLYARKSTEGDERQALSIDSQIKEIMRVAERDGLEVVDIKQEKHSSKKSGERPVFNQMISEIKADKFNGILTWAPDRLSRNAGDLGTLVDLIDQKILVEVRTYGQRFTNNPNEKFLLMILGSQAKLENDNKGVNVKRGLRAKCERGLWPSVAPTGYFNDKHVDRKGCVNVDNERAPIIKQMFQKVAYEQYSGRRLYHWLEEIDFKTKNGRHLSLSNVYLVLNNHFYYGRFEYPKGSSIWYTGQHTPLIEKELFELAQERISVERHLKHGNKEFTFVRLIECGLCGSGITAQEKFKKLKDGTVNRYIYYGCTRSRDKDCKNGYLREEELINQLINLMDKITLDKIRVSEKIKHELERYRKFQIILGGQGDNRTIKEIDLKDYAKYILQEGSALEKRELLECLKNPLILTHRIIALG